MKANNKEEAVAFLKAALEFFEQEKVASAKNPVQAVQPQQTQPQQPQQTEKKAENAIVDELEHLKMLLNGPDWPEAVPPFLICKPTDADKKERAEGMLEYLDMDVNNKSVLDYGCGEGHLVKLLAEKGAKSIGYDIKKEGEFAWETSENGALTTDWDKIKSSQPFDLILLYDVLDHSEDPVLCLKQVREVCGPNTTVMIRTHPFCGPHGGHLYQQINKAYVHLIFTDEELAQMGFTSSCSQKILYPLATCESWFKNSSFSIVRNNTVKSFVPDFFKSNKLVRARIAKHYPKEFPEWQMSQAFNDYVVKAR